VVSRLAGEKDATTPTESVKIEITPSAHRGFNEGIQERMRRLVYTPDVRSWYVDRRSGRNTLVWPGTQWAFWWSRCVRKVRWGDFEVERREGRGG
jgi:hypothetical protein